MAGFLCGADALVMGRLTLRVDLSHPPYAFAYDGAPGFAHQEAHRFGLPYCR
jgi:hypothetical protein